VTIFSTFVSISLLQDQVVLTMSPDLLREEATTQAQQVLMGEQHIRFWT